MGQPAAHVQLQAAHRSPRRPRRDRGARRRGAIRGRRPARQDPRHSLRPPRRQGQERHLLPGRRHGRPGGHRRSLLPVRRGGAPEPRPAAVHRLPDDVVGQAGRQARLRPRLGLHRHDVGDRCEDARRAHLAGSEQRDRRAGQEPADRARAGAEGGQEGWERDDRGAHRRDAGGARFAHLAARLPGPGRRRQPVQAGDEGGGRPRLDRRADRRPSRERRTRRRAQPLRSDDHGRQGRRQDGGAVRRAPGHHTGRRRCPR